MIAESMTMAEISDTLQALGMRVRLATCAGPWRVELDADGSSQAGVGDSLEDAIADAIAEHLARRFLASCADGTR